MIFPLCWLKVGVPLQALWGLAGLLKKGTVVFSQMLVLL